MAVLEYGYGQAWVWVWMWRPQKRKHTRAHARGTHSCIYRSLKHRHCAGLQLGRFVDGVEKKVMERRRGRRRKWRAKSVVHTPPPKHSDAHSPTYVHVHTRALTSADDCSPSTDSVRDFKRTHKLGRFADGAEEKMREKERQEEMAGKISRRRTTKTFRLPLTHARTHTRTHPRFHL